MAIVITEKQKQVYEMIKSNPKSGITKLTVLLGITNSAVSAATKVLMNKGMIVHEGASYAFKFTAVNVRYELKAPPKTQNNYNKKVDEIELPKDDELLHNVVSFEFTRDQIKIIKANKDMPRTQLAKKLGIGKLEFNAGLQRLKGTR